LRLANVDDKMFFPVIASL